MNGSSSTLLANSVDSLASSRLVGSIHGQDPNAKRAAAQISRAYKQASQFFLQRRFPESLFTIQPLITRKTADDRSARNDEEAVVPAPIATASRAARVKVWSLYITLLNSIVELGPEDGRNQFGNAQWRVMERKVRDGTIWSEVVKNGYGGHEGNVDPDVVSNLATLLLSQAPTQTITQQRLEAYLAACNQPTLDVSAHFDGTNGSATPTSLKHPFPTAPRSGTDTPRDLNSRIKILELYALHVLPRNGEWDYSKEFISMSAVLDDDTREEFLYTLSTLQDEQKQATARDQELQTRAEVEEKQRSAAEEQRMRDAQLEKSSQGSGARRRPSNSSVGSTQRPLRTESEMDYGIEDDHPTNPAATPSHQPPPLNKQPGPGRLKNSSSRLAAYERRQARKRNPPAPTSLIERGALLMVQLQTWVRRMAMEISRSPGVLLRTLLFVVMLLAALARQDVRRRIGRIVGDGWEKVKGTVGMGVKVSYI